jgi:hypothetical protein
MAMFANYGATCETAPPASAQNISLGWTNSFWVLGLLIVSILIPIALRLLDH